MRGAGAGRAAARSRRRPTPGRGCPSARRTGRASGCCTSARASATRCFSPPDNSCGRWCSRGAEADLVDQGARAPLDVVVRVRRHERRHEDVLEHRALRQQVVVLEHEADVAVAERGQAAVVERERVLAVEQHGARTSAARARPGCAAACSCRCPTARRSTRSRRRATERSISDSTRMGPAGAGYSFETRLTSSTRLTPDAKLELCPTPAGGRSTVYDRPA